MTSGFIVSYISAALLILLAVFAVVRSNREAINEKAHRHFTEIAGLDIEGIALRENSRKSTPIKKLFWRAGLQLQFRSIMLILLLVTVLTVLITVKNGVIAGVMVPVLSVTTLYMWLWQRANSRIKAILFQLPLFLDQTLRALGTGRSMESAIQLATKEAKDPLKEIFERVLRVNSLGDDLGQAIQEMAELYRVHELYLVSLAIRVNRTYGSSVRDLLNNIVRMIHDREAARRELRTMTGETRITAWVLGLLPIMIAAYILMLNPDYMLTMWQEESGRVMLITALILQVLGGFFLWRMIKSI